MTGAARRDAGGSMVSTTLGLLVFLVLLRLAAQVLIGAHANTVVTAATTDGARVAASARVDHADPLAVAAARQQGEQRIRALLGRTGTTAEIDWSASTPDVVVVHVAVDGPTLFGGIERRLPFSRLEHRASVRTERLR